MSTESDILVHIENERRSFSTATPREERSKIGQFLTPVPIARFMASLFEQRRDHVRILDPGAGAGALFTALVLHVRTMCPAPKTVEVTAYENDPALQDQLRQALSFCEKACLESGIHFIGRIHCEDFILAATQQVKGGLFESAQEAPTHVIINPPYLKMDAGGAYHRMLAGAGMETTNLYPAFVWLSMRLLEPGGELVAITPRSFCNGPYYRKFRLALLEQAGLRRIHLFGSRKEAFGDDAVLQENVIYHGVRGAKPGPFLNISTSTGHQPDTAGIRQVPYRQVVLPDDPDAFIHLVDSDEEMTVMEAMSRFTSRLDDLGLSVSTGRVVEFRSRPHLRPLPENGTAALVYPCHFSDGFVKWPLAGSRKPNAIVDCPETRGLLVPSGHYVVVRRFSSKEERRRVVAAIHDPLQVDSPWIGFENHLNYFHAKGGGMDADLARGLWAFLNAELFDRYFRLFSGHTQVNATDLRKMRYPSKSQLMSLGRHLSSGMPEPPVLETLLSAGDAAHV